MAVPGSARMQALRLGLVLVVPLGAAGCTDYLARRDTLLLETGNAVQTNIAVQVIDPWPPLAQQVNRDTDGERLQRGIERYRNPQAGLGAASSVPVGPSTAPPVAAPLAR